MKKNFKSIIQIALLLFVLQLMMPNLSAQPAPTTNGPFGSNINIGINGTVKYWDGIEWVAVTPGLPGQSLQFTPTWINNSQGITTSIVSSITGNTGISGGSILNGVGEQITARGVCWSTSHNPTISDNHTIDSDGIGSFTSSITGLTSATTYYVRAYATNSAGTAYGNEVSFITLPIVGNSAQGGVIAYILQSGDQGYDANIAHGLIILPSSLYNTTYGSVTYFSGGTINGYNDWYVPNNNELNKFYINRFAIGIFTNNYYWSSSSTGFFGQGYALNLLTGDLQIFNGSSYNYFILIRKF